MWTLLRAIGRKRFSVRRSLSVRGRWFLARTGCVFWASFSLWMRIVLTTWRALSRRRTRRARYVGAWHRRTRLGFIARRPLLPLRRIRRTRHLRSWC